MWLNTLAAIIRLFAWLKLFVLLQCFLPEEVGISVAMKSLTMADSQCLLFIKARPGAALSNLTAHCPTVLAAGSDWKENCLQPFHWSSPPPLLPYSAFVPRNAYCRPATYLRHIYCFVSQQAGGNMLITLHIKGLFLVLSDTFSSLDTVCSYFYIVSTDHSHSFKNGTCWCRTSTMCPAGGERDSP